MTIFALINIGVTLAFALFVMGSTICRITAIDMRLVRYRFVAPILMMFFWSASVFFSLIGGDTPDWYQPLCLLAISLHLWNSRLDWNRGMPHYMLRRAAYVAMMNSPIRIVKRVKFENAVVAILTAMTVGATAVGAMDGRGEPLQIYSAQAEPSVVPPNGMVKIVFDFRRVRGCPGYADRFIINSDTQKVAQAFGTTPIGSADIGPRREIAVPLVLNNLPVGRYFYRSVIYHSCPDGRYVSRSPDVPFVVAPAVGEIVR